MRSTPGAVAVGRPILVGVGDAEQTRAALGFAASEAKRCGLAVRLVHVLPRPSPFLEPAGLVDRRTVQLVGEELVSAAAEHLRRLTSGAVPIESLVQEGAVGAVLTDLADAATMVVLQHRELNAMARVVSGSVVVHVAGRSTVPVVSVPERWRPRQPVTAVTVAVDGHQGQDQLLERAFATAASRGVGLCVLHAWFLGTAYDELIDSRTPIDQWAKLTHQRVVELTAALRARYPQVSVQVDVRHQSAADAIVAAARHSDLLLVGRRHRKHGEHLGPVARAVITASRVPVMVVPSTALVAAEAAAQVDDEADDPVEADRSAGGRSA